MLASIATITCLLFILAVYSIDSKRSPKFSASLWLPLIWLLYCGSRPVSSWFTDGTLTEADFDYTKGSPFDREFLGILIILGLIIIIKRRINWKDIFRNNYSIIMLYAFMGLSILWSGYPDVSFKRWIRTIGDLTMVLIVLTDSKPFEATKSLLRKSSFLLLPVSILFIKYFRSLGVAYTRMGEEMLIGVTTHKNSLGVLAMIFSTFYFWNIITERGEKRRNIIDYVFLVISFSLLIISSSKTSLFVFLCGFFFIAWVNTAKKTSLSLGHSSQKIIRRSMAILIIISLVLFISDSLLSSAVELFDRDVTLTGRTDLWDDLIAIGSEEPIIGHGYGSFWIGNTHNLWDKYVWKPSEGHNGYIDVYVELGLVGLFLVLRVIYSGYRNIMTLLESESEYGVLRMALFIQIVVHNVTESSYMGPTNILWFLFLLVSIVPHKQLHDNDTYPQPT